MIWPGKGLNSIWYDFLNNMPINKFEVIFAILPSMLLGLEVNEYMTPKFLCVLSDPDGYGDFVYPLRSEVFEN